MRNFQRRRHVIAPLSPAVRQQIATTSPPNGPLFLAADHGISQCSTARSPLNRSLYDDGRFDCFEGNAKHQWVDMDKSWCHLCDEPVGGSLGVHLGDRDHVCMGLFLLLHSQYPRAWDPRRVLDAAFREHHALFANACGPSMNQDHMHVEADQVRRSELEAILWHLTRGPNRALTHTLQGTAPLALWVSGERIFKVNLSRLVAMFLPPMGPGVHSAFAQKCWGRSNQERMYEALNIATMNRTFGVDPKTGRESRAFFMRVLIWELHTALDNRDISPVAALLVEEALRRLSFELMFLQSMYYMNRIQTVVTKLGGLPSLQDLHQLNSL